METTSINHAEKGTYRRTDHCYVEAAGKPGKASSYLPQAFDQPGFAYRHRKDRQEALRRRLRELAATRTLWLSTANGAAAARRMALCLALQQLIQCRVQATLFFCHSALLTLKERLLQECSARSPRFRRGESDCLHERWLNDAR